MPQPTWVSESQPEIGSLPIGVISTGAAVGVVVVGAVVTLACGARRVVVAAERRDADRADGDASPRRRPGRR